jgi:catechol 2,3-dioxygenase-like lactoylglutathione lyase family enzyme
LSVKVSVHHVGITVSNLERTLLFFEDAFGLHPGMIFYIEAGPTTSVALALPQHAQRVALLSVGDVIFELIEFVPPRRPEFDGRQDDVGYAYPCFAVDDIDAAYDELTAKGYPINARPIVTNEAPVAGSKFMILKDPDGKNIEIVETGRYLVASNVRAGEQTASLDNPIHLGKH